jgi:uncharacterized protein YgiM (DUF1202 family)
MVKKVRVTRKHEASFSYSMRVRAGDVVAVGEEDEEMPGWFWCTDGEGVSAWIPDKYLRIEGAVGKILHDYDSIEHTVEVGEVLEAFEEANGWIWCADSEGNIGWVPADKVDEL